VAPSDAVDERQHLIQGLASALSRDQLLELHTKMEDTTGHDCDSGGFWRMQDFDIVGAAR
jgi:hypothetical protein